MTKPFSELSAIEKLRQTGRNAEAEMIAAEILMKLMSDRERMDVALMVVEKMSAHLLFILMNALEKHGAPFDPHTITDTFYKNVSYEIGRRIMTAKGKGDEIL